MMAKRSSQARRRRRSEEAIVETRPARMGYRMMAAAGGGLVCSLSVREASVNFAALGVSNGDEGVECREMK